MSLAFTDLETTGLNADVEEILEVACIVTDDKLVEMARFHALVYPQHQFHELDDFVRDMHTKNGLWAELKGDTDVSGVNVYMGSAVSVEQQFAKFLREHTVKVYTVDGPKGPETRIDRSQLAGNTISFDRSFLKRHMPDAEAQLHYRNFDVSSLNEFARRFAPAVYDGRPRMPPSAAHRAMADAEDSLRVARYYAEKLGQTICPPTAVEAPAGTLLTPQ